MPYSITCSTKILTLAIAPFLFILFGVLCEFAMVPGVYILLTSRRRGTLFFLKARIYTFSSPFIEKCKSLLGIILLCQGYC